HLTQVTGLAGLLALHTATADLALAATRTTTHSAFVRAGALEGRQLRENCAHDLLPFDARAGLAALASLALAAVPFDALLFDALPLAAPPSALGPATPLTSTKCNTLRTIPRMARWFSNVTCVPQPRR